MMNSFVMDRPLSVMARPLSVMARPPSVMVRPVADTSQAVTRMWRA
jgi:hypothetical protein